MSSDASTPAVAGGRLRARRWPRARNEEGQALVEFAFVLAPLFLILLGIVQLGFVFNTYITITNAVREAARDGSIYAYNRTLTSQAANDAVRNERMRTALIRSLNGLVTTAPNFANSATWTATTANGNAVYTNGDITVTYAQPNGIQANEPREGYTVTVRITYRQDLVIPLVSALLPRDANGRLPVAAESTMVIN